MRLKDIVILRNEKTTDTSRPYIALENIVSWDAKFVESAIETEGTNSIFKPNNILFGKLRPYLAKGFIPSYEGICSTEFFVLEAKKGYSPHYLLYLLLSHSFIDYIKNQVDGVKMPRTNWETFGSISVAIPSLSVQQHIVEYLDTKTKEIDKHVELLGKKREAHVRLKTAIINKAVTRGLNENVPLQDSGIDWLDQIPAHWKHYRLKDICEFRNGYTPSKGVEEFWKDGTIPWYRMEDIRISGRILKEAQQYINEAAVKTGGLFEADSFIVATTATIGEHARLIADSLANQQFTNLKIRKSLYNIISTDYFFYFLFIVDNFCKINYHFSTFPAVDMFLLRAMSVYLPPLSEQKQIASYLDDKCAKIDSIISNIDKQTDALKRLKRSLINEVISGKRTI